MQTFTLYAGDHNQETHTIWNKTEACCCYKGVYKDNKHNQKLVNMNNLVMYQRGE
jgi:hypothetical protein